MQTPIANVLCLDHFYISFQKDEIADLVPLTKVFKGSAHEKVVSGEEHWEGIYISSRTGAYLELVHEKSSTGCGIAMSARLPQYCDVRKIKKDFPKLNWKQGLRVYGKKKIKWYTWLSIKDKNLSGMFTWLMHNHFFHAPTPAPKGMSVDRFVKLKLRMGKKHVLQFKKHCQWIPGEQIYSKNKILLNVPDESKAHL